MVLHQGVWPPQTWGDGPPPPPVGVVWELVGNAPPAPLWLWCGVWDWGVVWEWGRVQDGKPHVDGVMGGKGSPIPLWV